MSQYLPPARSRPHTSRAHSLHIKLIHLVKYIWFNVSWAAHDVFHFPLIFSPRPIYTLTRCLSFVWVWYTANDKKSKSMHGAGKGIGKVSLPLPFTFPASSSFPRQKVWRSAKTLSEKIQISKSNKWKCCFSLPLTFPDSSSSHSLSIALLPPRSSVIHRRKKPPAIDH